MFLYDKRDNSLDVYEFTANNDDLINYRKSQMKQIPENERIIIAETRIAPYGETPLFEYYTGETFNDDILSADYADRTKKKTKHGKYHMLKCDRTNNQKDALLNGYYYGYLADKNIVKIEYLNIIRYYLLTTKHYNYLGEYDYGKNYIMENIIQIPESLYILQLLEQGRFTTLANKDISKQLELYTLSKIDEVNIKELQKMDAYGITQDAYLKTVGKAKNDSHILNLIKK